MTLGTSGTIRHTSNREKSMHTDLSTHPILAPNPFQLTPTKSVPTEVCVQYASDDTSTLSQGATPPLSTTAPPPLRGATEMVLSPTKKETSFVSIGNVLGDAPLPRDLTITNAQVADRRIMALTAALLQRRRKASTLLNANTWEALLNTSRLINNFPSIPRCLQYGFNVGIPRILHTNIPLNNPSLYKHMDKFLRIISHEFDRDRYLGPLSRAKIEHVLGPFQTSPLSLVLKPYKPNVLRLVQNYSYPYLSHPNHSSINSHISSDNYPCLWGTFSAFSQLILNLPPGSQGAV